MFGRSGRSILGKLGASVGQVWGLAGGFWRPGGKNGDVVEIKKNSGNLAKYWTMLCAGGVQHPGLRGGWGQSGLHGSIQGLHLAQDRPNIGPT